jgi:peptide/nickel transport system permease protein
VSVYDSIGAPTYTLDLSDATSNRINSKLDDQKRLDMQTWLVANGVPESEIDIPDTEKLLAQWEANYDPQKKISGMTFAKQRYYQRLDASLQGLLSTESTPGAFVNRVDHHS